MLKWKIHCHEILLTFSFFLKILLSHWYIYFIFVFDCSVYNFISTEWRFSKFNLCLVTVQNIASHRSLPTFHITIITWMSKAAVFKEHMNNLCLIIGCTLRKKKKRKETEVPKYIGRFIILRNGFHFSQMTWNVKRKHFFLNFNKTALLSSKSSNGIQRTCEFNFLANQIQVIARLNYFLYFHSPLARCIYRYIQICI